MMNIVNKMVVCEIFFLVVDIISNLIVDSTSSDPMIGFIIFIIQVLAILANLITVLMISSHDAIQNKVSSSKGLVHNLSALTALAYLVLTIAWHIWSLGRSWPAAGDQFNYSFLPARNSSGNSSDMLPFGSGFDNLKENREFYTLWSPGFITLYVAQRTLALVYYGIQLLSISILDTVQLSSFDLGSYQGQLGSGVRLRSISGFIDTDGGSPELRPQVKSKSGNNPQRQRRLQALSDTNLSPGPPVRTWENDQTLPVGT